MNFYRNLCPFGRSDSGAGICMHVCLCVVLVWLDELNTSSKTKKKLLNKLTWKLWYGLWGTFRSFSQSQGLALKYLIG